MCLVCALNTSTQPTRDFEAWNGLLTDFFKRNPKHVGGLLDLLQYDCPHVWDVLDVFTQNKPENLPKMSVMSWAMVRLLAYPHLVEDFLTHWENSCSDHIFNVVCWPFILEYNLNSGVDPLHQGLHVLGRDQIHTSLVLLCTRLSDDDMQKIGAIAQISPTVWQQFDSINSGRQYNILQDVQYNTLKDITQNLGHETTVRKI